MTHINWRRVAIGGLAAGMIWGTLYAAVHPLVEVHDSAGRPLLPLSPYTNASAVMLALIVVNGFVQGLATVWLYAAIRPRWGPGPRTAVIAGVAVWFTVSWVHLMWVGYSGAPFSALVLPLAANLPLMLLASLAGGWMYRERPAP